MTFLVTYRKSRITYVNLLIQSTVLNQEKVVTIIENKSYFGEIFMGSSLLHKSCQMLLIGLPMILDL